MKQSKFSFDEFLDQAKTLAQGGTECGLRSAISRAYYAIYHKARDYAYGRGKSILNPTVNKRNVNHSPLWQLYKDVKVVKKAFAKQYWEIGMGGFDFFLTRGQADYELAVSFNWLSRWKNELKRAEDLIKWIDALPDGP
ncbi:MAG: hypothetical protein AMXMBFR33_01980 [Candidatus Xenobia bacterium]